MHSSPIFLLIDLFCGFGGTTTGFEDAMYIDANGQLQKVCKVIACVNHDPKAIKSHWLNHPHVKHFEEDIRTLDLTELIQLVNYWRSIYPNAYVILWASLECTNFSKAKGGQPRDADSRTLAEHLFRYRDALQPDYIQIENVVEFMSWGPMIAKTRKTEEGYLCCDFKIIKEVIREYDYDDDDNLISETETGNYKVAVALYPESRKNGQYWIKWRNKLCGKQFHDDWKELNSADFGAYTSRNRLFGCFAKQGLPIVWPQPTHSKKASTGMFTNLKKWMPVKEVLNFQDEGESIFTRKKHLSDKTLERIYAGLIKYVAKGDTSFISKYYSGRPAGKVIPTDGPAGTITTADGQSLVQTEFLMASNGGTPSAKVFSTQEPCRVITTSDNKALVQTEFLVKYNSMGKDGNYHPPSIEDPAPVISTQNRLYLAQAQFLQSYYGNGHNLSSIESPAPTLPTKDRVALVNTEYFIDKHYNNTQNQSIEQPAGTLMPNDKHRLIQCDPFIMPTNFNNTPKSIDNPCPTITADRHHHYIVNPSHGGHSTSTDAPCPVIIARQDKAPLYLVQVKNGPVAIAVFDCDTEIMIKIKQFMCIYGLVDIKMRMLRVAELLKIQGFPEAYQMVGNQSDHKKFIGNSVHPKVPKAWAEALANKLLDQQKIKAA